MKVEQGKIGPHVPGRTVIVQVFLPLLRSPAGLLDIDPGRFPIEKTNASVMLNRTNRIHQIQHKLALALGVDAIGDAVCMFICEDHNLTVRFLHRKGKGGFRNQDILVIAIRNIVHVMNKLLQCAVPERIVRHPDNIKIQISVSDFIEPLAIQRVISTPVKMDYGSNGGL